MVLDVLQLLVVGVVIVVVLVVVVYLLGRVFGLGMKAGRQSAKVQYLSMRPRLIRVLFCM